MGLLGSAEASRLPSHYTLPYDQVSFHDLTIYLLPGGVDWGGVFLVILRVGVLGLNRCDLMMQAVMV